MQYRFESYVLDAARRELRRGDEVVEVQPLVFELLLYLVCHRDRVVPKDELLDSLWADAAVTDASLARAVSLARRAIDDADHDPPFIRTHPRVGYRFTAHVDELADVPSRPGTSPTPGPPARSAFTNAGGTHVAYQVVGDGPVDVVVVSAWVLSIASLFEQEQIAAFFERLAGRARLIVFDKRGTGLSDRVKELPGLAQRMEDLTAVLDAVGSRRAHVIGVSEGAPMALLYAASHPERVSGLALIGGFARMTRDDDQPFGWSEEDVARLDAYIATRWGEGRSISTSFASRQGDPAIEAWAARAELVGGSPGAALELWSMNRSIDVRDVLPLIETPCLVVHSSRDPVIDVAHGRQLAEQIEGARLVELDGVDHMPFFDATAEHALGELTAWIEAPSRTSTARRRLATLLLLDVGDDVGGARDAGLASAVEQALAAHRGQRVDAGAAKWAALFEGPAAAARCALAIGAAADRRGLEMRGALHCSEVECREGEPAEPGQPPLLSVAGPAVDDALALLDAVSPGETWATQAVTGLVVGSGIDFEPRPAAVAGASMEAWAIARA